MGDEKTPAEQLLSAIAALEAITDPAKRAKAGHTLQETMKGATTTVRAITDAAVREQRDAGASLADIARALGVSVQRVSQMATGKHGTGRRNPPLIYAFRVADDPGDDGWYGEENALPQGQFETGFIDFEPAVRNRFAGHRLQVRYGPVPDDGLPPAMHAYTTVNGRRLRSTEKVQQLLFAPAAHS